MAQTGVSPGRAHFTEETHGITTRRRIIKSANLSDRSLHTTLRRAWGFRRFLNVFGHRLRRMKKEHVTRVLQSSEIKHFFQEEGNPHKLPFPYAPSTRGTFPRAAHIIFIMKKHYLIITFLPFMMYTPLARPLTPSPALRTITPLRLYTGALCASPLSTSAFTSLMLTFTLVFGV